MLLLFVMLLESFQPASSYGITISWILSTYIVWCLFADFVLYAHPYPWKLCWAVCMLWQLMSYFVTLFYLESINQNKKRRQEKKRMTCLYLPPLPPAFCGIPRRDKYIYKVLLGKVKLSSKCCIGRPYLPASFTSISCLKFCLWENRNCYLMCFIAWRRISHRFSVHSSIILYQLVIGIIIPQNRWQKYI